MGEIPVPLSRRYESHGIAFDCVTLREPHLADLFQIGEPIEVHPGPDGTGRFIVEHVERVSAYLDRLAVAGKPGLHAIQTLDLADALAVKEKIVGFFTAAHRLRKPPTNSSGAPESPSETSGI